MTDTIKWKIMQDPVHHAIELDPLTLKIIDTREFQRMRFIKQLGCMDYVYPGATHTRFAHSIGVYHLACKMIDAVRKSIPGPENDIRMTLWEEECVRIAALCHDLGHGPFCHIYEEICREKNGNTWNHQDLSCSIVRRIFKHEDIRKEMISKDIKKSIRLIMRLIMGKKITDMNESEKRKAYMFQIIANEETSVDVDKWDYLCRDALHCGMNERFPTERAILGARVVLTSKSGESEVHEIGYPEKDALMFYNMFQTRYTLYRYIYRHRVGVGMNLMIKDIFKASDDDLRTERSRVFDFELFPIEETSKIPEFDADLDRYIDSNHDSEKIDKYLRLTDDIISRVRYIREQNVLEPERPIANAIKTLKRIDTRDFYKMHCEMHLKPGITLVDAQEEHKKCKEKLKEKDENSNYVESVLIRFNFGKKDENPMENMMFYNKRSCAKGSECLRGEKLEKDKMPYLLTHVFSDYYIRIYVKTSPIPDQLETIIKQLSDEHKNQGVQEREPNQGGDEAACTGNQEEEYGDSLFQEIGSNKQSLHF